MNKIICNELKCVSFKYLLDIYLKTINPGVGMIFNSSETNRICWHENDIITIIYFKQNKISGEFLHLLFLVFTTIATLGIFNLKNVWFAKTNGMNKNMTRNNDVELYQHEARFFFCIPIGWRILTMANEKSYDSSVISDLERWSSLPLLPFRSNYYNLSLGSYNRLLCFCQLWMHILSSVFKNVARLTFDYITWDMDYHE